MTAPFGAVLLMEERGQLAACELLPFSEPMLPARSVLLQEAVQQFQAYFDDPRWKFSLPLRECGTSFRQRVWRALCEIPVGDTRSYGLLATRLGSSPRAVAGACRANEFPIVVPCHRVVSGKGLGGYCGHLSGPYLDIKAWLLRHEGYDVG